MRSLWLSLILVAGVGATGCRASHTSDQMPAPIQTSTTSPTTPPVVTPGNTPARDNETADKRPRLVCFGNSLTAGHGADPGESYPDFLQKDLDDRGYGFRVINEGISGNTTKDGLDRVDRIIALHPAIVVVEFGGNDGLRGLRIEDTRANLDAILARLKTSGARIALAGITLPPDYGPDYIQQFQQTYTLMARKYSVPFLPFLLQGVYGEPGMMQADRTHATAKGNEIVAQNVLRLIGPFLKSR